MRSPSSENHEGLTQIETKNCLVTYLSHGWACISSTNVMAMLLAWPKRGGVVGGEDDCGAERGEAGGNQKEAEKVKMKVRWSCC